MRIAASCCQPAAGELGAARRAHRRARSSQRSDLPRSTAASSSPERTSASASASSGATTRSGPGPRNRSRTARSAAPVPGAGFSGGAQVQSAGGAHELDREHASEVVDRGSQLARRTPSHRHVVLLHRARGQRVDARRGRQAPVLGDHRRLGVVGEHQPRVDARHPGPGNGGSPCERPASSSLSVRRSAIAPDLGGGDRQEVAREPQRRAVEVAARFDAAVRKHHRIVDRGAKLGVRDSLGVERACRAPPRRPAGRSATSRRPGRAGRRNGGWRRSPSRRAACADCRR